MGSVSRPMNLSNLVALIVRLLIVYVFLRAALPKIRPGQFCGRSGRLSPYWSRTVHVGRTGPSMVGADQRARSTDAQTPARQRPDTGTAPARLYRAAQQRVDPGARH